MQGKPKPVRAHEREVGKGEKMKSIIISIQPKWCAKIESGAKTIEVRKTRPKIETPFKCYIYCTFPQKPVYDIWINRGTENRFLGNGKVIGEFVCDKINTYFYDKAHSYLISEEEFNATELTGNEFCTYGKCKPLYGWHVSDLKIYDKPKELGEFKKPCAADENCYLCEKSGFTPDMLLDCFNLLTRPPQSWCYVEELEE